VKILFFAKTQFEFKRLTFISGASPLSNGLLTRTKQDHPVTLEFNNPEFNPITLRPDSRIKEISPFGFVTFFEAITALAFNAFADAPVDVMILEVGMGGAWDATNVADATVAVFTPIDLDHTKQLGSTVTEIARTKAGIMKQGAFVVSAQQSSAVTEELRHAADDLSIQLRSQGSDFALTSHVLAVGGQVISVHGLFGEYRDLALPLH
jgi:dihydrofolate synthase/folylpolyglutamate synthase